MLANENGGADDQHSAAAFLTWLLENYELVIVVDGYERDVTDTARAEGVAGIYPAYALQGPTPWDHALIAVGMFRELRHGRSAARSLAHTRRSVAGPDDERLATYLDSGHLYQRATEGTDDYFDDDIQLGPPHLMTDGVYVWPADLPHYVRTYHVELPRAFIIHVGANGWCVPATEVATLPRQLC